EGIAIRNPLVAQIKKDYEKLFLIVRQAVKDTVAEPSVPDEEIGFLVMHFGASLERLKQFPRHVRALLVCTSGIGSSKLLEVRINKELPQIDLIGRASWFEASRYPEDQYDLIISTVDLPVESDRYIKISPLLTAEEAVKLRTYIQTITLNRLPSVRQESSLSSDALERLRRMSRYSAIILYILDQFECYREDIPPDEFHLKGILSRLCARLRRRSAIDRIEPIVNQLLERESYGSQIIPDTKLALFHTRSEFVPRPVLCLFTLDQPLLLDDQKPVHQILLMLAPLKLSSDSLEVLSEISSMLLSSELIHLLEQGDKASIQQFFSHELEAFLQNKMEWSD
ncbi:PTS sugar transporter subunit IIA, partial [Paenibacillus sepulcri]|nr:PTS sugar transporter subunit IIA [Paenibacillus sepulcri]